MDNFTNYQGTYTGAEIDNAVAKANNAVSKAGGDTLATAIYYGNKKKSLAWHDNDLGFIITNTEGDSANSTRFMVGNSVGFDLANAVWLSRYANGVETKYPVLHTGNKPSGSYTGTGVDRIVSDLGWGHAILIAGGGFITLATPAGAFGVGSGGAVHVLTQAQCIFTIGADGKSFLRTATSSGAVNASGVAYNYWVI